MSRRRLTQQVLTSGGLVLLGAAAIAVAPVPASAAADGPELITIAGVDLTEPLEIHATDSPEQFAALHSEVSWLVGRSPTADEPDQETLGPRYTLVVHADGEARHQYELYPRAEGGPRVFRPEDQPGDRTATQGWFFGRLSMPSTLRAAGAPIEGVAPALGGRGGGGSPTEESGAPEPGALDFLDEWWQGMALTTVVAMVMIAGLAGVALLIRRKV